MPQLPLSQRKEMQLANRRTQVHSNNNELHSEADRDYKNVC
ncbi:hypothetical protein ANCCAN_29537 [Ancylostoma caninum]|uniref:Uncharacterized protein n=1 Tax=Ancylostoma caninum TaxID=29170 RepID=A0A368F190_ANCCA|nr:hypothetical protein ANCCAN_29537 [Ancylostoma caninum]